MALLVAWGFGAVALHASGDRARELREAVQRSAILGALNDALPPSGPLLNVLRRVDPTPPRPRPGRRRRRRPTRPRADDPEVRGGRRLDRARARHRLRPRRRRARAGSPAPGLVVTNAHVVAGEDDTTVSVEGGPELEATAVHYDTRNDLAVLAVAGLERAARSSSSSDRGKGDRRRGDRLSRRTGR